MKSTKTKEQIVDAYENTIVLKVISAVLVIGGIVLAIIVAGRSNHTLTTVVLSGSFVIAFALMWFALRCPICDSFMSREYFDIGVVGIGKNSYRCDECNLSGKEIREYVDMLKRGVDVDANAIARHNKREL
ncbi:MAG TPA: hypothetical protein VFR78_08710 [Pyrinomonadaceae bacterium]|nr:hypothetical protein [Pyrinomonadaceae bacterium]